MKIFSKKTIQIKGVMQTTDYILGSNLISNFACLPVIRDLKGRKFLLVTDETIFALYGKKIIASLTGAGNRIVSSVIASGEKYKTFDFLPRLVKPFFKSGFDRQSILIAIGGGVTTDIGGFLASIILRGLKSVYVPTTLLGQIDAAVGGKTGVNFQLSDTKMYKNMIGTIHQPAAVISDVTTLTTLPEKEILNGLGEMAKYWVGWNKPLPEQLFSVKKAVKTPRDTEKLVKIIADCQEVKTGIVQADPFDTLHVREKLNLGHTIGHAIEGVSNGKLSHGQAVAIGLIAAAKISVLKGLLSLNTDKIIVKTIKQLGLPVSIRKIDTRQVISALKFDKKGGTFVLLKKIGQPVTNVRVEKEIIEKALTEVIL